MTSFKSNRLVLGDEGKKKMRDREVKLLAMFTQVHAHWVVSHGTGFRESGIMAGC